MACAYSPSLQAPLFRCGPCTVAVSSTRLALGNLKGPGSVHSGEQRVTGPMSPGPTASRIPAQGVKCPVAHGLWVMTSLSHTGLHAHGSSPPGVLLPREWRQETSEYTLPSVTGPGPVPRPRALFWAS